MTSEQQTKALIMMRAEIIELAQIMLSHVDPRQVHALIERLKALDLNQE